MSAARRTTDKKVLNVLHQIFHIAFRTPHDVADIFVRWSAHVDAIDISLHAGGWNANLPEPTFSLDLYSQHMTAETLGECRDFLISTVKAIRENRPLPVRPTVLEKVGDIPF